MSEAQKYLIDNNLSDIVLNEKELPENTPDNAKKWIYLSDVLTQYSEQQVSKLPIHGVSCIALDDLKKQLEIEKEDKERNKDNMFISTFQDGKIDATKKAIDILGGNCT